MQQPRARVSRVAIALLALAIWACGSDDDPSSPPARLAILSAFPAEMAPNLEHATITATAAVNGRTFRVGSLEGVPVVIGITGIGLVNAATTTRALLEQFQVQGVIVSAVAGTTTLRIGDVAVPDTWVGPDGTPYPASPQWLDVASQLTATGSVSLQDCASVPSAAPQPVCFTPVPLMVVGGIGHSSDPFGGKPFACQPNGGDLYGCDLPSPTPAAPAIVRHVAASPDPAATPVVEDMETAAIAREVAAHGLHFIAFRAVSDGPGDPLGLGGFLPQFSAYYHVAAQNAADATAAFLRRLQTP